MTGRVFGAVTLAELTRDTAGLAAAGPRASGSPDAAAAAGLREGELPTGT